MKYLIFITLIIITKAEVHPSVLKYHFYKSFAYRKDLI